GRLEAVVIRRLPLADDEDADREEIEQDEGWDEFPRLVAERAQRQRERRGPTSELTEITQPIGGEVIAQLRETRPFRRRHREPLDARAVGEQHIAQQHDAEAEPDRPPVFLAPQLVPARCLAGGGSIAIDRFNAAHDSYPSVRMGCQAARQSQNPAPSSARARRITALSAAGETPSRRITRCTSGSSSTSHRSG